MYIEITVYAIAYTQNKNNETVIGNSKAQTATAAVCNLR